MPYASFTDVQADFGDIPEDDIDKVETLLERSEERIRQVFPDLDARMADGRTSLILVKQVESEMVLAVLRNPNGYQSESQTIGGLSSSYTVNLAVASGLLRLTAEHRRLLGGSAGRAFTVRLAHSRPHRVHRGYRYGHGWVPE